MYVNLGEFIMTRELLIKMARDVISHGKANTIAKADDLSLIHI